MTTPTSDREIVVSRIINAPRERVWEAWTNQDQIITWWGPNGFTTSSQEISIKPGGVWRFIMHGPDGTDYPNKIVFGSVEHPSYIEFTHSDDGAGNQDAFQSTVTFEEHEGNTKVTLRSVFQSQEERDRVVKEHNAIEGGQQTLGRLASYLEAEAH